MWISPITLGVADLDRAREFYERLGWHGQETQETAFFQAGGFGLVLWAEGELARDAGAADAARTRDVPRGHPGAQRP